MTNASTASPGAEGLPQVTVQPATARPAGRSRLGGIVSALMLHLRRGLAWNLQTVPVKASERARLVRRGIELDTWQRYVAWRRSLLLVVLVPLTLTAILATLGASLDETATPFGQLLAVIDLVTLYALPATALIALLLWARPRWSRRVLVGGWLLAFGVPFATALFPVEWRERLSEKPLLHAVEQVVYSWLYGLAYYVTLMPAVLSLLPGLVRACLRLKTLLPASILPGWCLAASAPFSLLLWLVAIIALNHFAGSPLLIGGLLLWTGAPMLYVLRLDLFARPLATVESYRRIGRLQWIVRGLVTAAMLLLLTYLLTKQIFGIHLVGLDRESSLVACVQQLAEDADPEQLLRHVKSLVWLFEPELLQLLVEYLGRSLFMTVVFTDLLLSINLSVWRQEKEFYRTDAAGEYDRDMGALAELCGAR